LKQKLKELAPSDAPLICQIGLQLALNAEGVGCLVFPAEMWALRMVADCLNDEEVKEKTLALCDLCEKGDDAVAREAAAAALKERFEAK